MDASHFLQMNLGKWMTQRTTYINNKNSIYLYKSEILIEENKKRIEDTIMKQKVELISSYIIQNNIDKDIKYFYKNIHHHSYQLLQSQTINRICDHMNKYNHLSIKNISGTLNSIERLWLVNPNLRLGINVINKYNKCIAITFSSDIKII